MQRPGLAQAFDIMENTQHHFLKAITQKSTSTVISCNQGDAVLPTCIITCRGFQDHSIRSVVALQIDKADETLESIVNAMPSVFNVMQQIIMKHRQPQTRYMKRVQIGKICGNFATLTLTTRNAKLEIIYHTFALFMHKIILEHSISYIIDIFMLKECYCHVLNVKII